MICAKLGAVNGNNIYIIKTTTVPPGTGTTDCAFLIVERTEYDSLNYLLSGQAQADIAAGGGGTSGEFIPSYEAKQMICLEQNPTTGALQVIDPQPTDKTTCNLVAGSFEETGGSIFALDAAQGAQIGAAIWLVWALVWGFRMVARSLNTDSERDES